MQITKENTGNLTATIRIELEPADYQDKVNSQLKEYQQKANVPGFRSGKVPFGMVKKMYGKALIADTLNKLYSDALVAYIQENDIGFMGGPLASEDINQPIDLDNDHNYVFHFDIGLIPEFTLNISDDMKVDRYKIAVTDEMIDKYILEMRKRNGPVEDVDTIGDNDMVSGQFIELESDDTAKSVEAKNDVHIYMEQLKDGDGKKKLLGAKLNESIELQPKEVARSEYEETYFTGKKREQLAEETSKYQFLIKKITRTGLAEMNKELFDKVFPNMNIESEEQLREIVRLGSEHDFAKETDRKFLYDISEKLVQSHDFEMPEAFLKRFMLRNQENGEITPENIDAEFEKMKPQLKWQLIESKIVKEFNLDVTDHDVKDFIKDYFSQNIKTIPHNHDHDHDHEHEHNHEHHDHDHEHEHEHHHLDEPTYNNDNPINDSFLDKIADSYLNENKDTKEIRDRIHDDRIKSFLRTKFTTKEIETSYEDYITIISTQKK
jgi:trigger factor